MTGDRLNWWGSERCKDEIDSEEEKIACLLRILIGARLKIKENTFFFYTQNSRDSLSKNKYKEMIFLIIKFFYRE
jgi:hypothetical protein